MFMGMAPVPQVRGDDVMLLLMQICKEYHTVLHSINSLHEGSSWCASSLLPSQEAHKVTKRFEFNRQGLRS